MKKAITPYIPKRYAIRIIDDQAYWVTRVKSEGGITDNYTMCKEDATTFPDRVSAFCLINALELTGEYNEHEVVEL